MNIENNSIKSWENMFEDSDFSQGDVVRTFKRVIDVLRQIATIEGINPALAQKARDAIKYINIEPVNID